MHNQLHIRRIRLGALVLGTGLACAPALPTPQAEPSLWDEPPSSPLPLPVPAPWPETRITTDLKQPHANPIFRTRNFAFRQARWLQFPDRVHLVLDHHETTPVERCAADPFGTNHTLELDFSDTAVGEHPVDVVFTQGRGANAYTLTGTLAIDRHEADKLHGSVALVGNLRSDDTYGGTIDGGFTAEIVDCRQEDRKHPGEGPGAVQFRLDLPAEVSGELTYASLLKGTALGDLLVFRHGYEPACNPRGEGPELLNAIWVTRNLPTDSDATQLEAGVMPGQFSVKTWSYGPGVPSGSHNFGIEGSVTGIVRTETTLRGVIDVRAIDSAAQLTGQPGPFERGRIWGPFEAEIVDCSDWKGPYPI